MDCSGGYDCSIRSKKTLLQILKLHLKQQVKRQADLKMPVCVDGTLYLVKIKQMLAKKQNAYKADNVAEEILFF